MKEARISHSWFLDFPPGASSALVEFCLKRELRKNGFDLSLEIEKYEDVRTLEYVFRQYQKAPTDSGEEGE